MKDESYLFATYEKNLPKGCPKFDCIKANLRNASGQSYELYMTPDEAMLLANNLIGASLEALFDDYHFSKRFINSRVTWMNKRKPITKEREL